MSNQSHEAGSSEFLQADDDTFLSEVVEGWRAADVELLDVTMDEGDNPYDDNTGWEVPQELPGEEEAFPQPLYDDPAFRHPGEVQHGEPPALPPLEQPAILTTEQALVVLSTAADLKRQLQEAQRSEQRLQASEGRLLQEVQSLHQKLAESNWAADNRMRAVEGHAQMVQQNAITEATSRLKLAFDQAPLPAGIRFAPTNSEIFDYLLKKLNGHQEQTVFDELNIHKLTNLIPEVRLLSYARPWDLPDLRVDGDSGQGRVGYYFTHPEFRPNERRIRREAERRPGDEGAPCWKETCQPAILQGSLGLESAPGPGVFRLERRSFVFKLPGERDKQVGKGDRWKMYEYAVKRADSGGSAIGSDATPADLQAWVLCKVRREGPATGEEARKSDQT